MLKVAVISKTPDNWQSFEASTEADAIYERIKLALINLSRDETVWLLSPMNRGTETTAAEIAVSLKGNIKLECVIPFEEQAKDWSEPERDRYFGIIERCELENMLSSKQNDKSLKLCYSYIISAANLILLGTPPSDEIAELITESGKKVIEI
ncbi:MAG: DUF1273 family protein [Clostridia bacterium]|nr:DUF1273 family protein [Clostridia bacterium]